MLLLVLKIKLSLPKTVALLCGKSVYVSASLVMTAEWASSIVVIPPLSKIPLACLGRAVSRKTVSGAQLEQAELLPS